MPRLARSRPSSSSSSVHPLLTRPVAIAGESVLACVEKYDPVEHPRSHGPQ